MRRKIKSNRQGAVLMTVTVVAVMMVVIVAAAISLVAHTNTKTNEEYRKKQAYFAASSCLEAFVVKETNMMVDATHTSAFIEAKVAELQRIAADAQTIHVKIGELSGDGSTVDDAKLIGVNHPRWNDIDVTLKVEEAGSSSSLKATAVGRYLGQTEKVVAYMSIKPQSMGTTRPGALEIIGTNGGGNDSYNNISVYGNTSAPLKQSDTVNTLYKVTKNNSSFYGDTSIYGTLAFSDGTPVLKSNPYYVPGVNNDQTKGCTMYVSRSFAMLQNTGKVTSQYEKDRSFSAEPRGLNAYNYIQVDEAMIMTGDNAVIGAENYEIDIYTSLFDLGIHPKDITLNNGTNLVDAMTAACEPGAVNDYKDTMDMGGHGNDSKIWGNIYVRSKNEFVDGSLYLGCLNGVIHGDVYVEGDIYITDNNYTIDGNVYVQPKTGRALSDRVHGGGGTVNVTAGHEFKELDWTSMSGRSVVPNNFKPIPYYYYPEHMLCLKGAGGMTVSTIADTYKSFYGKGGDMTELKDRTDVPWFWTDDNGHPTDGTYDPVTGRANIDTVNFEPGFYDSNIDVNFTAVAKQSFVLGSYVNNATILVDLDNAVENADGRHDIVIILKNQASVSNNLTIIVKNDNHDVESDDARFCYLVSDSGVGDVYNEYYDSGKTQESTYSNQFNGKNGKAAPFFNSNNRFNLQEYSTYREVYLGHGLDPTDRDYSSDPNVYDMPHGSIIMLLTEDATFIAPQDTYMQCCIYGPRANFKWENNGKQLMIYPTYADDGNKVMTNIIGSCIVKNFMTSNNNNTVVYNPVSSKSMVTVAHGFGDSVIDKTFTLDKYNNF